VPFGFRALLDHQARRGNEGLISEIRVVSATSIGPTARAPNIVET